MMIALALDVGTKTIGVAVSDGLGMMAHPVTTLSRRSVVKDAEALEDLVKKHRATQLVVGLPLELDGSEQRSAKLARQVGEALAERSRLPVAYVDERFTSVDAERQLIAAGMSRAKRKLVIDQQAAVLILKSWLDARRAGTNAFDPEG
ncbi:MAG: Holliday junction resolvase RuvX [Myxococcota bacterium]